MEWAPEFDADADLARRLIAGQFPQLAGASVTRFGAGMDNVAYLVGNRYVFRFPRRAIVVPLIEREERILPQIAGRLPVAVPFPQFIGRPALGYPWTFAGYERVPGSNACSVDLSIADRAALARPLGAFLRALHEIDPRIGAEARLPGDEIGRLDHARRLPLARERFAELEDAGLLTDARPFLSFLEEHPPGAAREGRCIVHGDLYARHVLVDASHRLSGIIDWGDVHLGDPALDISVAFSMLPASAHEAFVDAYGGFDEETRLLATYRAIYHGALVAHFGMHVNDAALRDAGLAGLLFVRETL